MNTAAKLSAYGAALVLLTGGAYVTGSAVAPHLPAPVSAGHSGMSGAEATGHGDTHGGAVAETADQPAGLASSRGGYTLTPTDPILVAGTSTAFTFHISGPDGAPVTAFDLEHDKPMHFIVVRRDTTDFQHLHPRMNPDGTWRVPLNLHAGGSYRAFADFTATGAPPTTLGVDLGATGQFIPATHHPSRTARVEDYEVDLAGDLTAGQESALTLTVRKGGVPVSDLQPYLGAYGHLVALREGDLAYLHVHPDGSPSDARTAAGPDIRFHAQVPTTGSYRLFLDFQHHDVVHTVDFTVPAGQGRPASEPTPTATNHTASDHTAAH